MSDLLLFAVGAVVVLFAWLGLVVLPARAAQVDGLAAFAAAHGAHRSGDGRRTPFTVVGVHRGRTFTVTWQPGRSDILLVAVDCRAPDQDAAGGQVQDAALVTRWTNPAPAQLEAASLDKMLNSLTTMAEEIERSSGMDVEEGPED